VNDHLAAFRRTFRQVHALSLNIMRQQLPRDDRFLREMMMSTIRGQVTADYAFVFQYAFCRRESDASKVNWLAAAVHLLQSSAFVTDDIFDHSDLRYGHAALYKEYGVIYAIIATELMQSAALRAISQELQRGRFANTLRVIEIFNRVVINLYVGQYLDVRNTGNLTMTLRQYYRVIALGVGKYFEQMARCGALLANKAPSEVESLARYGYRYGMALFITDDIVDITNMPADTGKSYGCDLANRRMRLPVMLALRLAPPREAKFLRGYLCEDSSRPPDIRRAVKVIEHSGALAECKKAATRYVTQSLAALRPLTQTVPVRRLAWLSRTLLKAQGLESL
jgi:geranylgeranyl pyrophosphate synthase